MTLLGIEHVERNGHHYFRGLSMFPEAVQQALLETHGDLYDRHPRGSATLAVEAGQISTASVSKAPFGVYPLFDFPSFAAPLPDPPQRMP